MARCPLPVGCSRSERSLAGACGSDAFSPPDMDLSCLPIVPPVLLAWASAEDTFAETKCDRAKNAIPMDARCLINAPQTSWRHRTGQIGVLEGPVDVRLGSNSEVSQTSEQGSFAP
jgi:hypothetical protein